MMNAKSQPACKRAATAACATALTLLSSCSLFDRPGTETDSGTGAFGLLSLNFNGSELEPSKAANYGTEKLDTNSFILKVTDSGGNTIYEGYYGNSPETMTVTPGTYHITAVSEEFDKPAFNSPQWGDEQYVKVESGSNISATLLCRQMNCGVRLSIASSFLEDYPDAALLLRSSDGSLKYAYRETRTAFFNPGKIELVMSRGGTDEVLLSRTLDAACILLLQVKTASSQKSSGRISIQVDTTREYNSETYTIGQEDSESEKGSSWDNAYTISQAKAGVGEEDVWVGAYIVGGDLTNKSVSFEEPFSADSNLAIGPRSNTTSRESCMSVQLPTGSIREDLNLVDNPQLLGKYVYLKGDIVSPYFGLTGLKNVSEYRLK